MQGVLQLALAHLGTARDRSRLGAPVELLLGRSATVAGPAAGRLAAPRRRSPRGASAHGGAAFAPAARPDTRLAFTLLLVGLAARLLALGPRQIAPVLALALVFRRAGLLERDRDGLAAASHLAALAAPSAL